MSTFMRPRGVGHDVGAAVRTVRRSPGLYALLAVVIGLGVGATTAVYSVLRPLLLAPLPFGDAARLVWIENVGSGGSRSSVTSRASNLRDFRALSESFDGITGYNAFFDQATYTLTGDGPPEQATGAGVAHDFLEVLGVAPLLGRSFTVEEGAFNGPRAVLLSYQYWQRRFGGDRGVVGSAISLNGVPHEVAGVLPPSLDFTSLFTPGVRVDFLLPFPVSDETDNWGNTMFFIGRLRPGVTAAAAEAELHRVIARLQEQQPERWGLGARVTPLQAQIAGPVRPALLLLGAAAAAVMLIVCFNVANVLLARSPGRQREVAVRKALGATRGRVVRQLLFESLLVAFAGGAIGIALAVIVTRLVSGLQGMAIPLLSQVAVDGTALALALTAAAVAGVLTGLVPALQVADGGESQTLRGSGRGATAHLSSRRLREGLVIAELAATCALLVAGGLLLRSFRAVTSVDLGFESANAVAWQLQPSRSFGSPDEMTAFYGAVTSTVAALPGVEAVGLNDALPLGRNRMWGFRVAGAEHNTTEPAWGFFPHMIDPGYFQAMRIPLVAGRSFTTSDDDNAPPVVVVNETLANTVFAGENALGRRLRSGGDNEWEIVGVARDVRHVAPESPAGFQVYFPMSQMWDFNALDMVVRSSLPPSALAASVSAALERIDASMPTRDYWTLEATLDRALSGRRFTLQILGAFASVALLLAAIGIYGVLSQTVAERTREIGIRMALGETAGSVRRSVVQRTLLLAGIGAASGLLTAFAASRLVASLLYGVPAFDPLTMAAMAALLVGVAALSGLLPALRASRTDPLSVLRSD